MKKNRVKINGYYTAKVSDKLTVVRIIDENPHGGWDATNTKTGKKVRIKSPVKLRAEVTPDGKPINPKPSNSKPKVKAPDAAPVEHCGQPDAEASTDTTDETGRDTGQPGATGAKPRELELGKVTGAPAGNKMSLVDAAIQVMKEVDEPMNTKRMVELVGECNLWEPSRGGKTPHATLYSAILREIRDKDDNSRFEKVERGKFTLTDHA